MQMSLREKKPCDLSTQGPRRILECIGNSNLSPNKTLNEQIKHEGMFLTMYGFARHGTCPHSASVSIAKTVGSAIRYFRCSHVDDATILEKIQYQTVECFRVIPH